MPLIKTCNPFAELKTSNSHYNSAENEKKQRKVVGILREQGFKVYSKKGESYKKLVKPGFENQPFYVSPSGNVRIGAKDGALVRYDVFVYNHR